MNDMHVSAYVTHRSDQVVTDAVSLHDRAIRGGSDAADNEDNIAELWVRKIFWDLQRALMMGEDEEITGVVQIEIPE